MDSRKRSRSTLVVLGVLFAMLIALISAFVFVPLPGAASAPSADLLILRAEPWDKGIVPVWHAVGPGHQEYTPVRSGTRCRKLDTRLYRLEDGGPATYFHRVDCAGVVGYVHWGQAQ